ncbi:MAG TPA: hypothetical protein VHM70_00925 [Polyangiaceae bacterium]|nr:hypothetical protein [Polyangiaceae bacterium]
MNASDPRLGLRLLLTLLFGSGLLSACHEHCNTEVCDIHDRDCQQRLMNMAVCLHGGKARTLEVHFSSTSKLAEQVQTAPSERVLERRNIRARAYALLGLERLAKPDEVAQAFAATVGAYYDPTTDDVTVVSDTSKLANLSSDALLVHEFTHALQEQIVPSAQRPRPATFDEALAQSAVIEGDAALTEDRAVTLFTGFGQDDIDWEGLYEHWSHDADGAYPLQALPVTLAQRSFVYAHGAHYVNGVRHAEGQAAVNRLLRYPPSQTSTFFFGAGEGGGPHGSFDTEPEADCEQLEAGVLEVNNADAGGDTETGDAGLDAGVRNSSPIDPSLCRSKRHWDSVSVPLLRGWHLFDVDALGYFVMRGLFERLASEQRRAMPDMTGEDAVDALSIWTDPQSGAVTAALRIRYEFWANPKPFKTLLEHNQIRLGARHVFKGSTDILVLASEDEAWLESLDVHTLQWLDIDPTRVNTNEEEAGGSDADASGIIPSGLPHHGGWVR